MQFFRVVKCDHGIANGECSFLAELTQGTRDCFASGTGHAGHFFMREQQWNLVFPVIPLANLLCQLDEESR